MLSIMESNHCFSNYAFTLNTAYCIQSLNTQYHDIHKALLRINITDQSSAVNTALIKFMPILNQFILEELKAVVQGDKILQQNTVPTSFSQKKQTNQITARDRATLHSQHLLSFWMLQPGQEKVPFLQAVQPVRTSDICNKKCQEKVIPHEDEAAH